MCSWDGLKDWWVVRNDTASGRTAYSEEPIPAELSVWVDRRSGCVRCDEVNPVGAAGRSGEVYMYEKGDVFTPTSMLLIIGARRCLISSYLFKLLSRVQKSAYLLDHHRKLLCAAGSCSSSQGRPQRPDPKNYLNLRSLAYQFSHNLEMHQQSGWTSLSNHHIFPLKHDDKDLIMKSEMSLCYWGLESLDLQRQERRP